MLKHIYVLFAFLMLCVSCSSGTMHDLDSNADSNSCDPNDLHCQRLSAARMRRIEEFRTTLLEKLDLDSIPNISAEDLPSPAMIESLKKRYGTTEKPVQNVSSSNKDLIILAKPGHISNKT